MKTWIGYICLYAFGPFYVDLKAFFASDFFFNNVIGVQVKILLHLVATFTSYVYVYGRLQFCIFSSSRFHMLESNNSPFQFYRA